MQQTDPCQVQQQTGAVPQPNEQLRAYKRKWDEELEGFKKLVTRLQVQALSPQQVSGSTAGGGLGQVFCSPQQPHPTCSQFAPEAKFTAAIEQAEALLTSVYADAVRALSTGDAVVDAKLLAKQLRLQRNSAFEAAKAIVQKAVADST